MKNNLTKVITISSVMAAFSVVLNLMSVRTDTSLYTIYALPLLIAGILYGPVVGLYSGLATGIIVQIFTYGITPTTILWLLAPASWGLFSGFISYLFDYKIKSINTFAIVFICSTIALIINTLALKLDGLYYGYSTAFIYSNLVLRIISSFIIGIFYFIILVIILPRISKIKVFNLQKENDNNNDVIKNKKVKINLIINKK